MEPLHGVSLVLLSLSCASFARSLVTECIIDGSTRQTPKLFGRPCATPNGLKEVPILLPQTARTRPVTLMQTNIPVWKNDTKREGIFLSPLLCCPMPSPNLTLVQSGTTSHMTAPGERFTDKQSVTTEIHFAGDSTATTTETGIRKVICHNKSKPTTASLSSTLVVRNIKTSLMSVPALVNKDTDVPSLPRKALFIDMCNLNTEIRFAMQHPDGLFYICDSQDSIAVDNSDDRDTVRAIAVALPSAINIDADMVSFNDDSSGDSSHSERVSPQTCSWDTIARSELASDESSGPEDAASLGASQLDSSDGDTDSD